MNQQAPFALVFMHHLTSRKEENVNWNWSKRCRCERNSGNFHKFSFPVKKSLHYFFRILFFEKNGNFLICKYFFSQFSYYCFAQIFSYKIEGGGKIVFIFHENKLPSNFFVSRKNRKTVCFLLFSKLPFTHFRYSINLIAIPLSEEEKTSANNFSFYVCDWKLFSKLLRFEVSG